MPSKVRSKTTHANPAVGYQFEIHHLWAEPPEPLQDDIEYGDLHLGSMPEIEVTFKDKDGDDCGRRRIKFLETEIVLTPTGRGGRIPDLPYLVNNTDLADLLHIISACAAQ